MRSEAQHFLQALFNGKPNDLYILIWTLADKLSHWFQKIDDASRFVESSGRQDIYVGTGLATQDYGPFHRCKSDDIAGSIGVFSDIDIRSDAHPNAMLPRTIEEALSLLPAKFPPSFVISTGNGIHAWWLFREPWIFQNDEDRREGAALAKRWNTMISDDGRLKGWNIDRLGDLARILRIPGTTNYKDAANPKNVCIHIRTDSRYNASDLVELLDDLGVQGDDQEERAKQRWAQQFQNKPLNIDPAASISQEQLERWIESDLRFKKTWFRQRLDLQDQSQSGYDLALVHFGNSVGLGEQEIINLMIQHRRIHKEKPRTRLDYFYRTLSMAANRRVVVQPGTADQPESFTDTTSAGIDPPESPQSRHQQKTDRDKLDLCKKISVALNVELLRMVKVLGDEPFYRMELAEGSIAFQNVRKLITQTSVKAAIAAKVGRLIPHFKSPNWQALAQMMLDACIDKDGGEELESQGAARLLIEEYLANTTFIPSIEGQSQQDRHNPMMWKGEITVCSLHLQNYVNTMKPQTISTEKVVGMLMAVGAKVERVRGQRFKEQSRWMLPLEHFDPADYPSAASGGAIQHG